MELYEIILNPCSGFGTPLKGDTLFGHFCWQAAHDPGLLEQKLEQNIAVYADTPFAIFSSAFPRGNDPETPYFFKRPDMNLNYFGNLKSNDVKSGNLKSMNKKERIETFKAIKKKKWINMRKNFIMNPGLDSLYSDNELINELIEKTDLDILKDDGSSCNKIRNSREAEGPLQSTTISHNSIHRLTGTTGTGMFAPFEMEAVYFYPEMLLSVFVLINPEATDIDRIVTGLARLGKWGFGKDAATGMGRFDIMNTHKLSLPDFSKADALYTLAPCVPTKNSFRKKYFTPFVRFGKHGDTLATSSAPFKNPVIMADEGAVLFPETAINVDLPYVGRAVTHVSKAMPETVVQGYAPVLPINLKGGK